MKWIGQHIWDFISRFRGDVYIENLSTTTETDVLVVDSNGKVSKNTIEDLHYDTSSQSSVNNSGTTYVQDVTLDTYGHVTGLTSAAIPTLNQDTTGTAATVTGAAQTNITSVGTLTNLQVDFVNANASALSITDSSDTGDYFAITTSTHGVTTLVTVDDDATAAHLSLNIDGDINIESNTNKINKTYDFNSTTFESTYTDDQASGTILKYSPGNDDSLNGSEIHYLGVAGRWSQADADGVANGASQLLGVAIGGSARTYGLLLEGFVRIASTEILNVPGSGEVDGLPLYISTTAGHFDFTAPSGSNDYVRIVGYAIDDDSSDVLVYFKPDNTWVEIA